MTKEELAEIAEYLMQLRHFVGTSTLCMKPGSAAAAGLSRQVKRLTLLEVKLRAESAVDPCAGIALGKETCKYCAAGTPDNCLYQQKRRIPRAR